MKKIIFVILMMIVCIYRIPAQLLWDRSKPDRRTAFGILAGFNYAYLGNNDMNSSILGFHAGGFLDYHIIKSLALEAQVSYVQKGFEGSCGKATMYYVQIPLLLSFRFETQTHVLFHLNIGPYYSYGFGGSIHLEPSVAYPVYYFHQDSFGKRGFFQDYDYGFIVGGAIQLNKIKPGCSYEHGFMNIAEVHEKSFNRNIAITAGVYF